jgi:hypothetical protein
MGTDEAYRHAILDLPWFPNPTSFDIHPVKEFLNQFDHLSDRWGGVYEALSETIIIKAAMHQYTQFDEDGHADDVYNIGDTHRSCARYNNYPILTALRCLVNIKSLAKFAHHFPMKWTVDEGFGYDEYELLSPDIKSGQPPGSRTLRPHIAVKVMPPNTELRDSAMSKGPEFQTVELLQLSIENTRRRLLTGNPRHWPEAFFAICILFLVHFDLELISGFTDTLLTAQHILRDSIESLCQLFLHCSGDLHPLHESRLDEEWLELVMGTDFEWDLWKDYIVLNEIWVANRKCPFLTLA